MKRDELNDLAAFIVVADPIRRTISRDFVQSPPRNQKTGANGAV